MMLLGDFLRATGALEAPRRLHRPRILSVVLAALYAALAAVFVFARG